MESSLRKLQSNTRMDIMVDAMGVIMKHLGWDGKDDVRAFKKTFERIYCIDTCRSEQRFSRPTQ